MHSQSKILFGLWLTVIIILLNCAVMKEEPNAKDDVTPSKKDYVHSYSVTITRHLDPEIILSDIDLSKGKEILHELIQALDDEDPKVRAAASIALGAIGSDAQAATSSLIDKLLDDESEVRSSAALALGYIGGLEVEKAVPLLLNALKHDDISVSAGASIALERIGINPQQAFTILDMLKDENSMIRFNAARALYGIGPDAVNVLPALIEALEDNHPNVRFYVCQAIGKLGINADSALPELHKLAAEDPFFHPAGAYTVRLAAEEAIAKIEGTWEENIINDKSRVCN